jgi:hypothetical protein
MLRLNVVHKLRKWLQREHHGYANSLHRRVGVGLTAAEFYWCVKMLEVSGCCTVTTGDKGAVILTVNEQVNNVPTAIAVGAEQV